MLFKDISYLELWRPPCSSERHNLVNFGRGHNEKYFCEIILILGQWFKRRWRFDICLILSSGVYLVQRRGTVWALLAKGIMRNYFELEQVV